MSDVEKYIAKRKKLSPEFAKNFEAGYQKFKENELRNMRRLKALPALEGYVPEGWKEAIYDEPK